MGIGVKFAKSTGSALMFTRELFWLLTSVFKC